MTMTLMRMTVLSNKMLLLCLLAVWAPWTEAFPSGAPAHTCMTMFPKHNGAESRLGTPPFEILPSSMTYNAGERIPLTISATGTEQIKGVQIKAIRQSGNTEEILGQYDNLQPVNKLRYINCQEKQRNMVTHNNSMEVSALTVTWIAPATNEGPIYFDVTIVSSYTVFYFGIKTPITPGPTLPVFVPQPWSTVSNSLSPINWDTCGDDKGCMLYPAYCSGDDCKAAVSYAFNNDNDTVTFEMMAESEGYVAVGFSHDSIMGDDQTIICTAYFERVSIQNGYNHHNKYNVRDLRTNLTNLEVAAQRDGKIYCRFSRPVSMELLLEQGRSLVPMTFDLREEFHLFLAWGHIYSLSDVIGFHNEAPVISDAKVDFTDNSNVIGSVLPKLVRAHGSLMTIAWLGFAVLAIVMPRYYKDGFNDKKICGIKIWFHIHRTAAIMTFALTVAGLVLILVKLDGEVTERKSAQTHMYLGFTVVALVCAQLVGGMLRPGPDGKVRPFFNVFHKLLGSAALIIAAATIVYAYKMSEFSYPMQRFGERTVAVWAGVLVFLEILLYAHQYLAPKFLGRPARTDEYNVDKLSNDLEPTETVRPSNFLLVLVLIFVIASIISALYLIIVF
ncbi:putative ferric-chelate reductase 1 homolog [Aplysia californica]|uniref:Ferric-chelate reductase 1 homolog n=1 Tax=Aplysia californica TaxID=6500 RepID=A0ABM1A8Q2_APLCA|nr:putative ferric-chelate reductase 1 homolog [Aplysia californica]